MNQFKPLGCSFHGHSCSDSLDAGATVSQIVKRAKLLGRPAVNLTGHGLMCGLAELHLEAKKAGLQCVHGVEAYVISPWHKGKTNKNGTENAVYAHMTVHFKTDKAYEYFCRLSVKAEERAVFKFGEKKPLITMDELRAIGPEIVLGSGCLGSLVQRTARAGDYDLAEKIYQDIREIPGQGNFFVEIMPHVLTSNWTRPEFDHATKTITKAGYFKPNDPDECGNPLDVQKAPSLFMLKMAKKYGDPVIVSEDSHLSDESTYVPQIVRMGNGKEAWRFSTPYVLESSDFWFPIVEKQLGIDAKEYETWIDNSYLFLDRVKDYKFYTSKDRVLLPTTKMVTGIDQDSLQVTLQKVKAIGLMPSKEDSRFPVYKDRLQKEINILYRNGTIDLLPYFLLMEDVVSAQRAAGNFANPRGSAGGSLLLYLLGVSVADPIKYDLSFERFLTLGRITGGSLPDIDTDFADQKAVFEYIKKRYGAENMARVATETQLKLKNSIKDVERLKFGYVRPETELLTKMIPNNNSGLGDKQWVEGYTDPESGEHVVGLLEKEDQVGQAVKSYVEANPEVWKDVLLCLGVTRNHGVHSCSAVITPEPVNSYVPLMRAKKGDDDEDDVWVTAYTGKFLEHVGLVKYDFLGVESLRSLSRSMEMLRRDGLADLKWEEPPHDPEVYKNIFTSTNAGGVFQVSGKGLRPFLDKMPVRSIEDLSAMIALVRPGALDAPSPNPDFNGSAAAYYMACANGKEKPFFIHESIKPFLEGTYGIVLFQEQLSQIVKFVLDLDDAEADGWRRDIGKKNKQLVMQRVNGLEEGAIAKGWTPAQAKLLAKSIEAGGRYSFNCMGAEQKIQTSKGPKTILEIAADKEISVAYIKNGMLHFERPVFAGQTADVSEMFEFTLEDGSTITCTADHKVWTEQGWMTAEDAEKEGVSLIINE